MRDWKSKLETWIHAWDDLPELTRDCFPIRRPVTVPWKSDLPSCPTLIDFYTRCDGGTFGSFDISSMTELNDPSSECLADSPGLQLKPGRWIQFGNHNFGHHLLWDADADEVVLYSPDDEEPTRLKQTMSEFFDRLLHPSKKTMEYEDDESNAMWIEALKEAKA
jgi:hypothetical protein